MLKLEDLNRVTEELADIPRWMDQWLCQLPTPQLAVPYLLGYIALKLSSLEKTGQFGANYYDIRPVTLGDGTGPKLIIDKQSQGLVRKAVLWIDSATGGPTPIIRVSKGANSYTGGGIKVNASQSNDLGEIPPNVQLFADANTAINGYIIEWA